MYNTLSKWLCHKLYMFVNHRTVEQPPKLFNIYIQTRFISAKEISTALRQFYFSVHPDLFGKYPKQRRTNENSLKQLSAYIEAIQSEKTFHPCTTEFYLRDVDNEGKFKLIKIPLKERNIKFTIINILQTSNLSTKYIDEISTQENSNYKHKPHIYHENDDYADMVSIKRSIYKVKESLCLSKFLKENYKSALDKYQATSLLRKDIKSMCDEIYDKYQPIDIRWDCGWNILHYRGCLQSFRALGNDHPEQMKVLRNRVLVFSSYTGVDLNGHIMLYIGEVRNNWLDFLKNVKKHDDALLRIPNFEKSVSHMLRGIQIVRRKYMHKIVTADYERDLLLLLTTLSDFRVYGTFPDSWPESLQNYKMVAETASAPLTVSPTGQFIVPCTCPSFLLNSFITENLKIAAQKIVDYNAQKHIEKFLHLLCVKELKLESLRKDDNVTLDQMIKCCESLLESKDSLGYLAQLHLNITTYYSVLSDGIVCIPWSFKL